MLPRTTHRLASLSCFSFVLKMVLASPVYNLQPAYITATIGSTGRNIRNLPCVSRKSNQSGVCMFAIDCLKANGTHLGTCIDRFYFGSCCRIEPLQDLTENTIDTALIPSREPPYRTSSTPTTVEISTLDLRNASAYIIPQTTQRSTPLAVSEENYKISTFQTVKDVSVTTPRSQKPSVVRVTYRTPATTPIPKLTTRINTKVTKPRPQTTPKSRPTNSDGTSTRAKPKPTKPIKVASASTTHRPSSKPVKVSTSTTRKPIISSTGSRPIGTPSKKPSIHSTPIRISTISPPRITTHISNDVPTNGPQVSGNPISNEIESATTVGPTSSTLQLITWSELNKNDSHTSPSTTGVKVSSTMSTQKETEEHIVNMSVPGSSSTTSEATQPDKWAPGTDGWVLLPNLVTITEADATTFSPMVSALSSEMSSSEMVSESSSTTESGIASSHGPVSVKDPPPPPTSASSPSTAAPPTSVPTTLPTISESSTPPTSGINMSDFTDVCGRRMVPEGRIVGGDKSAFGKWPWQISLRQWRTSTYLHKCGAALLNENWAITAAHCVDNVPPSDLLLRLGEHDLSTELEPYLHQERRVQIVASHPQFDPRTFEYDLALLRFYEPVTFQPNIIPVCVPQSDENFVGRNAFVTGWGRLYEDGPLPSILQEVSVPVINNTVCESMYRSAGYIEHIPNIFICAGWRRGGFDSCEGDSGGPMVIQRGDKRFILAGVISWGIGCAEPNQPGVYTRISEFRDWINQILQF